MELSALYSQKILAIAANQPVPGRLAAPDATSRKRSAVCGSTIIVDIAVDSGVITGYGHEIAACAFGQTAAALVAQNIVGSSCKEFRALREKMTAMLKSRGAPPEGKWADLDCLVSVRDFPARHASALLVFDAVVAALDQIEGRA